MPQAASPNVLVVGSINMDLVVRTARAPDGGQTVLGSAFATIPGGKGANQAVGAARLVGHCTMIGRVGQDSFGATLRKGLADNGVDTRFVLDTPGVSSGVAVITVEDSGQNRIVVVGGANARVTPADLHHAESAFQAADVCLLQLELPIPTVVAAVELCRRHGVKVVLDPAPAAPLPDELFTVDVLTPNESEATQLLSPHPDLPPDPSELALDEKLIPQSGEIELGARATARSLLERGPGCVVLKLGARGALFAMDRPAARREQVPAFRVTVVDSTAAGDAFTAGLGVALAEGQDWPAAVRFANACGALACTVFGAQPSLPTRAAVEQLLASQ